MRKRNDWFLKLTLYERLQWNSDMWVIWKKSQKSKRKKRSKNKSK